jgi:hypothetical protein
VLHDAIVGLARGRRAEVLVVAPALNTGVRHWLSDEDGAREAAQSRLSRCLASLRAAGVRAWGWVGDADPMLAIDDALRLHGIDEILIATHPEQRSNWLARNLIERTLIRFGLPTAHIAVDVDAERAHPADRVLVAA